MEKRGPLIWSRSLKPVRTRPGFFHYTFNIWIWKYNILHQIWRRLFCLHFYSYFTGEETRVEETTKTKHKLSNSWVKSIVSPGKPVVALLGKCFILMWDRTWPFELVFSRDNHIFFPRKIVILRKLLRSYWWFPLPTLFSCFFKVIIIWNSATWERWNSLIDIWLFRFGS